MAINKQTIISAFDDKLTLLQWLKTINKALDEAVLTGVEVRQKGNATYSFVVTFEDGTELESNEFVLAQGESINGATIRNGHLYLSLTNGDELDAGNVKPVTSFEINASQHLIVNYGDGTSQDLGAIFSGNVNVDGNFTANSIIENMNGYKFFPEVLDNEHRTLTYSYAGVVKTGNKITFAIAGTITTKDANTSASFGRFTIPLSISEKLYPTTIGEISNILDIKAITLSATGYSIKQIPVTTFKSYGGTSIEQSMYNLNELTIGTVYHFRSEITFLLSDNLAGN